MLRKILLLILSTSFVTSSYSKFTYPGNYRSNSSKNLYSIIINVLDNIADSCQNISLCRLIEQFKIAHSKDNSPRIASSDVKRKKSDDTAVQAKSYYGGAATPTFYPAFDPISILASLAFLAFILQSFASLFDRSRSIIPTVVNSRNSPPPYESPDPLKLILLALDEYEIFNDNVFDEKSAK